MASRVAARMPTASISWTAAQPTPQAGTVCLIAAASSRRVGAVSCLLSRRRLSQGGRDWGCRETAPATTGPRERPAANLVEAGDADMALGPEAGLAASGWSFRPPRGGSGGDRVGRRVAGGLDPDCQCVRLSVNGCTDVSAGPRIPRQARASPAGVYGVSRSEAFRSDRRVPVGPEQSAAPAILASEPAPPPDGRWSGK